MNNNQHILTIVTRHMPTRQKLMFARMKESIRLMPNVQLVTLLDPHCAGWQASGRLMHKTKDRVTGYYVWVLDDDDECTCAHLPFVLERLKLHLDPDIIIVKNWMEKHGILPSKELWAAKDIQKFEPCTIGFPGFILKNRVYKECIVGAQATKSRIDWSTFKLVQKMAIRESLTVCFLDLLVMRQAVKMNGCDENIDKDSLLAKVLFGGE